MTGNSCFGWWIWRTVWGLATLHSFICGYRLACGIHRELAEEPVYSFAREEEERACSKAQVHDKDDTDA